MAWGWLCRSKGGHTELSLPLTDKKSMTSVTRQRQKNYYHQYSKIVRTSPIFTFEDLKTPLDVTLTENISRHQMRIKITKYFKQAQPKDFQNTWELRKRRAEISAYVTPPMNTTRASERLPSPTLKELQLEPDKSLLFTTNLGLN